MNTNDKIKDKLNIGIKFCGNCNPHINSTKIYEKIKNLLPEHIKIVNKDSPEMDLLIVLSSCPIDCASRPGGSYKEITVAGETLNRYNCQEKDLPDKIINILTDNK